MWHHFCDIPFLFLRGYPRAGNITLCIGIAGQFDVYYRAHPFGIRQQFQRFEGVAQTLSLHRLIVTTLQRRGGGDLQPRFACSGA